MIDRIDLYQPSGGPRGLGYIRGSKRVDPREWFFCAHFYQDPVCPGSLGLESFLQVLKFAALHYFEDASQNQRFAPMLGEKHRWIYRGQILPENGAVTVEAAVTRIEEGAEPYLLADGLREAGYRVIAPARFGYLGAPIPARNDAFAQADAFAELLDKLAVDRAIVMGASAGAITALAFAERYPERTAALLLMVPAYYPPEQAAPEPWSPVRTWAVSTALRSDFLFWAGMRLAPTGMLTTVLAMDRDLVEAAYPEDALRAGLEGRVLLDEPGDDLRRRHGSNPSGYRRSQQ